MGDAPSTVDEARDAARRAGLRYVSDEEPGITRRSRGKGFSYYAPGGNLIRDLDERDRLNALAVRRRGRMSGSVLTRTATSRPRVGMPSAEKAVPLPSRLAGHPRRREVRRMSGFGRALPGIRRRTAAHLKKEGLPREKVLAAVVRLLERSLIRVGNYEYARSNGSFGLTTLRDRHVDFRTWAGTIEMAAALMECGPCEDESEANRRVAEGVKRVAERLGNTPAVCRECYIHPEVVDRYLDGTLAERLDPGGKPVRFEKVRGLTVEESAVLALIEVWSPEPTATG